MNRLLLPAAACCCLLLPAAACCCLLLLLPAAAAACCCCRRRCCCAHKDTALPDGETPWPCTNGVQNMRFPRPERPFWNLLQKACYTFLEAGCWLAAACCCLRLPAAACGCLLPAAACGCLLLPAAAPTKTRPSRMGKHHGPEGRTESKIGVSRGRNVPSEIS